MPRFVGYLGGLIKNRRHPEANLMPWHCLLNHPQQLPIVDSSLYLTALLQILMGAVCWMLCLPDTLA